MGCSATVGVDRSAPADPPSVGDDAADDPDIGPTLDGDPELIVGECGFDVPDRAVITCGTVAAPLDYRRPGEATVELAVAVLASTSPSPAAAPVIYLEGGPGGHAVDTIPYVWESRYLPLLAERDVIVFDQRGTGRSRPRLDCPELDATNDALATRPDLTVREVREIVLAALGDCRNRLTDDGIDVGQFHTAASAHDVARIIEAVDAGQVDLFGISYGTRLALDVLRLHPGLVRAAVLDSTLPPEVDATAATATSLVESYRAVTAACDADAACRDAFGDLDGRVRALYDQLEAEPLAAEASDVLRGETTDVVVDGDALVGLIAGMLYDPFVFGDLPEIVADLETGSVTAVEALLDLNAINDAFSTDGMFLSVICRDEVSFTSPSAVATALPDDPLWATVLDTTINVGPFALEVCDVWDSGASDAAQNDPVVTDTPVLLLAGAFDPVTPPAWARDAAARLPNGRLVEFPTLSHGVTSDDCGMAVAVSFLRQPSAVEVSCVDELTGPAFVAPQAEPVALVAFANRLDDFGADVTGLRPDDWQADVTGAQHSRGRSLLDPTALVQIGVDAGFADQIAELVAAELGVDLADAVADDVDGRAFRHRSGVGTDDVRLDVWIGDRGELAAVVMLISTDDERDALVTAVAMPALAAIEVAPQ